MSSRGLQHTQRKQLFIVAGGMFIMLILSLFLFWPRHTERITNYAECVAAGHPILETYPPMCRSGEQTFTGPSSPEAVITPSTNVSFDLLVNGDLGNNIARSSEIIQDQKAWVAYWTRIHAGRKTMPPLLPVDFTKSTVIAINEGQQMTGGYVYKVSSITQSANSATVNVTESIPTIGCTVTQSITNRYYIVRADKLHGEVIFRTSTDRRHCDATDTVQ